MLDCSIEDAAAKIRRIQDLRLFERSKQTLYTEFNAEASQIFSDFCDLLRWEKTDLFDLEQEQEEGDRVVAEYNEAVQERDALADLMKRLGDA